MPMFSEQIFKVKYVDEFTKPALEGASKVSQAYEEVADNIAKATPSAVATGSVVEVKRAEGIAAGAVLPQLGSPVGVIISNILDFRELFPIPIAVGGISKAVESGVGAFGRGDEKTYEAIGGSFRKYIGGAIEGLKKVLETVFGLTLVKIGGFFLTTFVKVFSFLADKAKSLFSSAWASLGIGVMFGRALGKLAEMMEVVLAPILNLITDHFFSIAMAIQPFIMDLLPVLSSLFTEFASIIQRNISLIMPLLIDTFKSLAPVLLDLVKTILPLLGPLVKLFVAGLKLFVIAMKPVVKILEVVTEAITKFFDWLIDKFNWLAGTKLGKRLGLEPIDIEKFEDEIGKEISKPVRRRQYISLLGKTEEEKAKILGKYFDDEKVAKTKERGRVYTEAEIDRMVEDIEKAGKGRFPTLEVIPRPPLSKRYSEEFGWETIAPSSLGRGVYDEEDTRWSLEREKVRKQVREDDRIRFEREEQKIFPLGGVSVDRESSDKVVRSLKSIQDTNARLVSQGERNRYSTIWWGSVMPVIVSGIEE